MTVTGKGGSTALCTWTANRSQGIRDLGVLNTPGGGLWRWKFVERRPRIPWECRLRGLGNTWCGGGGGWGRSRSIDFLWLFENIWDGPFYWVSSNVREKKEQRVVLRVMGFWSGFATYWLPSIGQAMITSLVLSFFICKMRTRVLYFPHKDDVEWGSNNNDVCKGPQPQ